jgi:hypothetical protein
VALRCWWSGNARFAVPYLGEIGDEIKQEYRNQDRPQAVSISRKDATQERQQ